MGEILGLGITHYPPLSGTDDHMADILRWTLDDPGIPEELRSPEGWPAEMRAEYGSDGGIAAAAVHRAALVTGLDRCREALDAFQPDAVLIWGDDQYENFQEDLIPPFAILAYPDLDVTPWAHAQESSDMEGKVNHWGEGPGTSFKVQGHPELGRYLAGALIEQGIEVGYAYRQLHHPGLPHAFLNAVLYLDYHRVGFPYPVVSFPINCYGRRVVSYRGFLSRLGDKFPLDPPSPSPRRMMQVGAATARALIDSPWRVALVASSSWSHAFMCDKTWRLHPDTESDRELFDAMAADRYETWRARTLDEIENAGQQEMLNWFALLGAMDAYGHRVQWSDFVQTNIFNSNKVFAIFAPGKSGVDS